VLALLVGAALIVRPPHISPFGMRPLARDVLASGNPNPLVLVVGETRAEGALIAAFAELDRGDIHYVLRGTQMLASGGFMAQGYATRYPDAAAVGQWLTTSGIGWLVLQTGPGAAVMAHDRQVERVIAASGLHPAATEGVPGAGAVLLYRLSTTPPTPAQMAALLARVMPNMSAGQDQKNASNRSSTAPGASSAR
ncbi:MAG: hypothetical protein M3Y41_17570, partial [Pseudomonadota bacterium]|nr:hypothetical protein [Pseudomonadota bacterium]